MRRRLLFLLMAVSLPLCLAMAYRGTDMMYAWEWHSDTPTELVRHRWLLITGDGDFGVVRELATIARRDGLPVSKVGRDLAPLKFTRARGSITRGGPDQTLLNRAGFRLSRRVIVTPYPPSEDYRYDSLYIWAPLWFMAAVLAVPGGVVASRRLRNAYRRRHNLCPACGYNLRATPVQCPECGAGSLKTPA